MRRTLVAWLTVGAVLATGAVTAAPAAAATLATVSGSVTAHPRVDVAAIDVDAYVYRYQGYPGCALVAGADVASDGTFELDVPVGATFALQVEGPGIVEGYVGGGPSCTETTHFTAAEGLVLDAIALEALTAVTGVVEDGVSGLPVDAAYRMDLFRWIDGERWLHADEITPRDDGSFSFVDVRPGRYTFRLSVNGPHYYDQYLGGGVAAPGPADEGATFAVTGDTVSIEIGLHRSRHLAGAVSGLPAEGTASLTLYEVEVEGGKAVEILPDRRDWVNTAGPFTLTAMAPGSAYVIEVKGGGLVTGYVSASGVSADLEGATVWHGDTSVDGLVFTAERARTLELTPQADPELDDSPVWATLYRWSTAASEWRESESSSVSSYADSLTFTGLAPGAYAVWIAGDWGTHHSSQWRGGLADRPAVTDPSVVMIPAEGGLVVNHALPIAYGATASVTVTSVEGRSPRFEARRNGTLVAMEHREGDGQIRMPLVAGTYDLRVTVLESSAPDTHATIRSYDGVTVGPSGVVDLGSADLVTDGGLSLLEAGASWSIQGRPEVGQVLRAYEDRKRPAHAAVALQWMRDGRPIPGATGTRYTLTRDDVGSGILVRATGSAPGYATTFTDSSPTDAIPTVQTTIQFRDATLTHQLGRAPATAHVDVDALDSSVVTGTIRMWRGGVLVATLPLVGGSASYTPPASQPVGTYTYQAEFISADPRVDSRGPAGMTLRVTPLVKTVSSTRLVESSSYQRYGTRSPIKLTARVAVDGSVPVSGVVVFREGKRTLGTRSVVKGKAVLTVKRTLAVGRHKVTATFVPTNPTVAESRSTSSFRVRKATAKVTATVKRTSIRASKRGKVTVKVVAEGVSKRTGTLTVYDRSKKIKTVKLKASHKGRVTITLPALAKGTHKLRVHYSGSSTVLDKKSTVKYLVVK